MKIKKRSIRNHSSLKKFDTFALFVIQGVYPIQQCIENIDLTDSEDITDEDSLRLLFT